MKSPQTEDGFTQIANELLEAFTRLDASGSAWRVFMVVLRKTYGFHKKEDCISLTQFEKMSGLTRMSVCRGLNELIELRVITAHKEGYINTYQVQKDYGVWSSVKPVTSNKNDTRGSIKPVTKTSNKNDTYKRKKDISTKETSKETLLDDKIDNMNNLIAEVIKAFEAVDPKNKNYYKNKTQREACEFLIEQYGFQEVIMRVSFLRKAHAMDYFPVITTPVQLRDKWVSLEKAVARLRSKPDVVAF
jgi:phage replication O-like protein O